MPWLAAQEWAVLASGGTVAWWALDRTVAGAGLAVLSATVCPLAELVLMRFGGLWHYPRADALLGGVGLVSWCAGGDGRLTGL